MRRGDQRWRHSSSVREGARQRRPPLLDPLDDRLGAEEREGDDDEDDGRLAPCDGTLGAWTELPEPLDPLLVDGLVWVELPLPLLVLLPLDPLLPDDPVELPEPDE